MFAEADRRDPGRQRTWIALADGNAHQIARIQAEAAARGVEITIICDFIHVIEYLWKAWQRLSAGKGAKGQRYYDWAWAAISSEAADFRWLLIRRHPRTGELAFYRCHAPQPVTLAALVKIAGLR